MIFPAPRRRRLRYPLAERRYARPPLNAGMLRKLLPGLSLVVGLLLATVIGGPGALVFTLPGLFWCGLRYSIPVVALLGLGLMLLFGTLTWDDVLGERTGWDTLIWFGGLVGMATMLSKLGLFKWFSGYVSTNVTGMEWLPALVLIVLLWQGLCSAFNVSEFVFPSPARIWEQLVEFRDVIAGHAWRTYGHLDLPFAAQALDHHFWSVGN